MPKSEETSDFAIKSISPDGAALDIGVAAKVSHMRHQAFAKAWHVIE